MRIKKTTFRIIVVTVCSFFLSTFFISLVLTFSPHNIQKTTDKAPMTGEMNSIKEATDSKAQVVLYTKLINRVGPVNAQEDLLRSGLPFDGQTHLLNHTVGDWLYKKYGSKGLIYCKDYFLSSCYHGLIIPFIAKEGIKSLDKLMTECWKVGMATVVQCAHGVGHGLLAWENYPNLPKALADCDTVASLSENFPSYNCYDGIFMENNWAVHNDGKPAPERWMKPEDPSFPCFDDRIGEKYRRACWSNQPQVMYKLFNGDLQKVAAECLKLENQEYQVTCFDAIARQINPITRGSVTEVFRLCKLMPEAWQTACILSNVSAFFSVGDRDVPFEICSHLNPEINKKGCYSILQYRFAPYSQSKADVSALCNRVPMEYRDTPCR